MSEYGFPASAIQRVKDTGAGPDHITTSELSLDEQVLVRKVGFKPVGFCLGSCFYHVGFQLPKMFQNQELTVLSQAMYNARELAMTRMRAEARAMHVDGVIGVRLTIHRLEEEPEMLEFVATGTGILNADRQDGFKTTQGEPFISHLSGQDLWKLIGLGLKPVEMVMGSCVYHIAHRGFLKTLGGVGQNLELTNFSQATYQARETAMLRMQEEAKKRSALQIVKMTLAQNSHSWPPHITEFLAMGTAVVAIENGQKFSSDPQLVLSVNS